MMSRDEFERIDQPDDLSRQDEVLLKFLQGKKDAEIAKELVITKDTVRKHIENINEKFGLKVKGEWSHRPALMRLFAEYKPELLITDKSAEGQSRVVISYWNQKDPSYLLAQALQQNLSQAGYHICVINSHLRNEKYGAPKIEAQIRVSNYFILLLSYQAAAREMIAFEAEIAARASQNRINHQQFFLPILVDCGMIDISHNKLIISLRKATLRQWISQTDPQPLVQEIANLIAGQITTEIDRPILTIPQPSSLSGLPIPEIATEAVTGPVFLDSGYYIERYPMEQTCYQHILTRGALIRIKGPRQMGKTSLMNRILDHATKSGYQSIALNCQQADPETLANADDFFQWFCRQISRRLGQLESFNDNWDQTVGIKERANNYFEDHLLPEIESGLVIGLDEVDLLLPHEELKIKFLSLLRAWNGQATAPDATATLWGKLRLVLVYSTEAYIPFPINQSPFNVGIDAGLRDFTKGEAQSLAQCYQLFSDHELDDLLALVGGHPFLLRLAFFNCQQKMRTFSEILATAATDEGIYSDHLQRHLHNLSEHTELAEAMTNLVNNNAPIKLDDAIKFKLKSMGLVSLVGNLATLRCQIYRSYFAEKFNNI